MFEEEEEEEEGWGTRGEVKLCPFCFHLHGSGYGSLTVLMVSQVMEGG